MKNIKNLSLALSILLLSACGGPSYEGEYVNKKEKKGLLHFKFRVVLGEESFIESFAGKQFCDSLEEREADNKRYLTCTIGGQQLPIEIIDEDTIVVTGMGKMYRVK